MDMSLSASSAICVAYCNAGGRFCGVVLLLLLLSVPTSKGAAAWGHVTMYQLPTCWYLYKPDILTASSKSRQTACS